MNRYSDAYCNTITINNNIIKSKQNNNSRLYDKGILSNHCISTIPSIAKPITYARTHGHTNIPSISKFCKAKSYKQYNIITNTSNLNYMKHLRMDKFTQLRSNDYNDNTNIPPQVTIHQLQLKHPQVKLHEHMHHQ